MKVTSGVLGSRFGTRLLWITVLVSLAMGIALTLLLVPGSATADGPDEFTVPIVLEEGRTPPKVGNPPNVRVQRQVQGQGASITQQTSTALVSNTGQTTAASPFALDRDRGQSFRTGTSDYGYKLTSVEIDFHTGGSLSARIYIRDGSIELGKLVAQLKDPPSTLKTGLNTFEATGSGVDLNPSSWYFIHLDLDAENTDVKLANTNADGEDSGKAVGWEIADPSLHWPIDVVPTGGGEIKIHTHSWQIRINGYAKVKPDLVKAEVNGTSLVLTYDNNLDTTSRTAARQFGIKFGGGGALQRATAISISGRQVTLTVPEVRAGQVVTVSYTKPTSNPLKGSDGVEVDALSNQAVTVNTGPAYGRLPEGSEKVRDAVYVTYNNADGDEEVVENRAASADRETLYDYFYDACSAARSLTTVHDYSQHTEIVTPSGATRTVMTQARNGWKWVWVQDANGAVTGTRAETVTECANSGMYLRQAQCANEDWRRLNTHLLEGTCPEDRTW